jgi:hypothetical protein
MHYLPRIISIACLWGAVVIVIIYVEPDLIKDILIPGTYLPFFVLLAITVWYSVRSFWIMITIMTGIILTTSQLMHWGLLIVLMLTLGIESWYIYRKR